MSVYDRGCRPSIGDPSKATAPSVGPGSYSGSASHAPKCARTPFMSTSVRDTHINLHDTNVAAPGPGHYDIALSPPVRGCYAIKCKRFAELGTSTPGPGHYDTEKKPPAIARRESHSSPPAGRKVTIVRKPSAPSIPSSRDSYGFQETSNGILLKQSPPSYDSSLGPAYYDVEKEVSAVTAMYKGVHWGKRTSLRNLGTTDGEKVGRPREINDIRSLLTEDISDDSNHRKSRSALPRHFVRLKKVKDNLLEDGHVAPASVSSELKSAKKVELISRAKTCVERPPFGSKTERFNSTGGASAVTEDTVGDTRASAAATNIHTAPFGQKARRFEDSSSNTPGPGSYNATDLATESLKKAYAESVRRGVFGSTTARIEPLSSHAVSLPGPAHYHINVASGSKASKNSASFLSATNRFKSDQRHTLDSEPEPPGMHALPERVKSRRGQAHPPMTVTNKQTAVFRSTLARFAPPSDFARRPVDPFNPSPGTYDPQWDAFEHQVGAMVTYSCRFGKDTKDDVPGPGQYTYPKLLQDTVLKGSFNTNLAAHGS